MIELTSAQCCELDGPAPMAIDPRTKQIYMLVPQAEFQRFRDTVDRDDILATGEMADQVMAEDDANDPYLHEYQTYMRKDQK